MNQKQIFSNLSKNFITKKNLFVKKGEKMLVFGIEIPLIELLFALVIVIFILLIEIIVVIILLMQNLKKSKEMSVLLNKMSQLLLEVKRAEVKVIRDLKK